MSEASASLVGSYSPLAVTFSILIAVTGSYVALELAAWVTVAKGTVRRAWLLAGTISMAIAIWSMHYSAMWAFRLPIPIYYHVPTTFLAFLIAVAAAGVALYVVTRNTLAPSILAVASLINGGGIVGLHYTGMASMRLDATCHYSTLLVGCSCVIAVSGSLISLWLTFWQRQEVVTGIPWIRVGSALVMGAAISAMHFTGMASATFFPAARAATLTNTVTVSWLVLIAYDTIIFVIFGFTFLSIFIAERSKKNTELARVNEALKSEVAERTRAELELRRLSAELLRSQDEERRRIGRELHDSTAQNLGALSAMLHQLRELASPLNREARKLLSESKALADVCIREVRTFSYVLHPAMLDASGLEDAIRHFVDGYTERTGIQVELEISPTVDRMEHTTELSLFRIVQESLTNIQRHSGSPYARIRLVRNQDCLILEIIDVGRKHSEGIRRQHGAASFRHGVGIPSMQERAKSIGARIDIDSGGNGTTVRVTIPLGEE